MDVGRDVMSDLLCFMAQADPTIECYRAKPNRTTIRSFFKDLPQTDMMSPIGAPAVRFFESKLFFFSIVVERTDGRVVVRPVKYDAADDVDARAQRDRIGGRTTCRVAGGGEISRAAPDAH